MGVYLRGRVYHYKRMIDGRTYYRSLKIHKGQEPLLSGRIKQVDDEITAAHFVFDSNLHCYYYSLGVRKGKEFMKVTSCFF